MQWARRPTSIAQYTCRQLGSVPIPKASPTSYQAKSNWSVVKAARQPLTLGTRNVKKHFRSSPSSDPLKSLDEDQQLPHTQHISPTYATADPQEMYSKLQRHAAQQQLPPGSAVPQQTPFSPHQSFKYAQLGHSRFSRGSPHVCYWHLDGKGMFYVKPEWYELVAGWQDWLHAQQQQQGHQHQPPGLGFQQAAGLPSNSSSSGQQQRHFLPSKVQSSSVLSALAAAVAIPLVAATAAADHIAAVINHQHDWARSASRLLLLAAATAVLFVAAAELGRRMVSFMLLCYSGLSYT